MMMSVLGLGGASCSSATTTLTTSHKSLLLSHKLTFLPQSSSLHSHSLPFTLYESSLASNPLRSPFTQLRFRNSMLSALSDDGFGGTGGRGGGDDESRGDDGEESWSFLSWIVKKLEPMNTLTSSVWWVIGFYLIVVGGQALLEDFWLTVFIRDFETLFNIMLVCIGMACVIFCIIAIIAVAYALKIRQGASEEYIRSLPKYRFSQSNVLVLVDSCNGSHISEISLHPDDSECSICLCPYVDGAELYRLPCIHHFHSGCISCWLRIKATCPLCNFNIRSGYTLV